MVAAAVVGSAVVGAAASTAAASKQSKAASKAADATSEASEQMRADLQPYNSLGTGTIPSLISALGYTGTYDENGNLTGMNVDPTSALQQKFSFTGQDLQNTPGYQFTLQQGLKGTNNALAAQGLSLSGAQAKGLSSYTTGLADQTYNQQYNNALSAFNTNYQVASNNANNLLNLVNLGQNSAAQTGNASLNAANTAGNYNTQAANAQAAGITGASNALSNGANNYLLYSSLYGK